MRNLYRNNVINDVFAQKITVRSNNAKDSHRAQHYKILSFMVGN